MTGWEFIIAVCIQLVVVGALWGDLRRQVSTLQDTNRERHSENQEVLKEIRDDVHRINSSVSQHDVQIEQQGEEINRLRRNPRRER